MKKQFLSTKDLAQRWDMTAGTLSNWRMKRRGPKFMKAGWSVRYPLNEVEKWEKSHLKTRTQ